MATKVSISDILIGCEAGRMQSVGGMQVVPILSDQEEPNFSDPREVNVSTSNYGTMHVENETDEDTILPCHAGYVTKQSAQDHAMPTCAIIKRKSTAIFDNAMCIEQSQGGYIDKGKHRMLILPLALRTTALAKRDEKSYNKLWSSIGKFNESYGITGRSSHLVYFLEKFKGELDQFVAEFELVPGQIGAIILVNGQIVGIERAPSQAFWAAIWQPLIRECYGSYSLYLSQRAKGQIALPPTRARIEGQADSLQELEEAIIAAEKAEGDIASKALGQLAEVQANCRIERKGRVNGHHIETLEVPRAFSGQIVRANNSEKVCYGSVVAPIAV